MGDDKDVNILEIDLSSCDVTAGNFQLWIAFAESHAIAANDDPGEVGCMPIAGDQDSDDETPI